MNEGHTERDTVVTEKMGLRIVALLLLVAAVSVYILWSVNPIGPGGESIFALYLAVDLVAVAMIAYIQGAIARDGRLARAPLVGGCCFMLLLVLAGLYLLG